MTRHPFQLYSLQLATALLLSGCASATFYSRGNPADPPEVIEETAQVKQVSAEIELPQSADQNADTDKPNADTVAGPVSDDGEKGDAEKDSLENKSALDYLSGRNVAADIPYANKLPWVGAPEPSKQVAQSYFERGEELFAKKDYAAARTQYAKAANRLPDSSVEEDALFKIAECSFFEDQYSEAFESYEALLVNYKRSKHLDTAVARQFAIGRYWQKRYEKDPENVLTPNLIDKTRPFNDLQGSALRAFEKVRFNHPTGPLADDSLMATATADFLRRHYDDADYYYGLVRQEYPGSEHQYQAHVLGVQAKIRRYQGPNYEGTCLQEAKELIEQTLRQFGKISEVDRKRLQKLHAQVSSNLALRDFNVGKFYAAKGYHGAARSYYQQVLEKYPHTDIAQEAENKLEETQGESNNPEPRFVWISSLFPETRTDPLVFETSPVEQKSTE